MLNQTPKRIALLGATGSIGTQALEIIAQYPNNFVLTVATAHRQVAPLLEIANRFGVTKLAITDDQALTAAKSQAAHIEGLSTLLEWIQGDDVDIVLVAMVGFAGLLPVLRALQAGKTVALANKEVLVVAGELVMGKARANMSPILPIDSEHAALFQCLGNATPDELRALILTASGGPFWDLPQEQWASITPAQALRHPRWSMGQKVSIDSATMMNKGLEIIEAYWLFDVEVDQIDVWIHPECHIHSMVEFIDGSIKAQLSTADMRLPIQAALSHPNMLPRVVDRLSVMQCASMHFFPCDHERFPAITLCQSALRAGGTMPCALSTADEVAVQAFIENKIQFLDIIPFIQTCLDKHVASEANEYEVIAAAYAQTKKQAQQLLKK